MSSCRRQINGGSIRVAALDGRPSFYRILFPGFDIDRLPIPRAFTGHILNDLQEKAKLRGPSGGWWEIKLGQKNGKHYIKEGWKQFFDHHSLGDYEFLIFRYNGGLRFDVQIFDKTGCERMPKFYKEHEEHEEHHHHHQPAFKRKRGRPRKNPTDFSTNTEDDFTKHIVHEKQVRVKIEEDDTVDSCLETDTKDSPSPSPSPSLRSLDSFASVFPYFKCVMTTSCVEKSFIVTIPLEFSDEYFPRTKTAIFTRLNNIKGQEWTVKVIYNKYGKRVISAGWSSFARDNHIRVDNVCVFELLDGINLIRVHVLQDSEEDDS